MTVNYTTLLGLAQPVPGTEVGTWGTTINDSLTALIESATAGTTSKDVTAAGDWTLTTTGSGAANEQRMAIIRPFGTPGASRNIIAPAQSKIYVVVNASNGAIVFKSSTSTGVTIPAGKTTMIAWNSAASSPDFAEVTPSTISGTLPVANGGTGVVTLTGVLKGNGTSAFTAATAGTDYSAGTSALTTGILKSTTSTGALTIAVAGTDYQTAQSVTGMVKSSGTTRSAATAGTDYSAGTSALATGILKSTTSTGALTIAVAADFPTLNQNTTGTATTATTATNLASGSAGTIPYQSAFGTTVMLAAGTSGQILTSGGAGAPTWSNGATLSSQLNLTNASDYNLYASGAGGNYMASNLGIGGFAGNIGGFTGYVTLNVSTNMGGSTSAHGIWQNGIIQSSVTNAGYGVRNSLSTAAATFTLPIYFHYYASQSTIGAGSTVATQYGFYAASSLTGASVNVGFYGGIAAGSGRYNLQMVGTADNLLNGPLSIGTGNPANASSLLDVQSTTKGVRFPNMTTTQKNAIATPAAGLMVFDTTLSKLCVYSGSAWETVSST